MFYKAVVRDLKTREAFNVIHQIKEVMPSQVPAKVQNRANCYTANEILRQINEATIEAWQQMTCKTTVQPDPGEWGNPLARAGGRLQVRSEHARVVAISCCW